ncbi:NAD(P)H-dependent oxidoreductase [Coraliomargarita sp. SDUM461003]|uniref:FMN dependent NADH:quinone oxidoreductase n=1 Tax=Thalassobacterium maritimum TaxID=3041265 RepID=A0ABU1AY75_9BACT|nr:NAD(P)H-dependent oxidoreductase [Coraliomargarita sp. SDUM461003]MDQ8209080.1 NAD(P)H-dependent oxidoreductase [Coraliomargarita sp. SDUM461003]
MKNQTNLLMINGSARSSRSLSRMLTQRFLDSWHSAGLTGEITQRDVGKNPPPFISEEWIASAFTPEAERSKQDHRILEYSDQAIAELSQADVIVIATPMYNYGLPAAVKAWFDQVIRVGKTFSFDLARGDTPLEPILSGKRLVTLSASGEFGFDPGGVRASMNHLHPHIQTMSKYLGVSQSWNVSIEYQEFGDERFEKSKHEAIEKIEPVVRELIRSFEEA